GARRIPLPAYPFAGKRYWLEGGWDETSAAQAAGLPALLAKLTASGRFSAEQQQLLPGLLAALADIDGATRPRPADDIYFGVQWLGLALAKAAAATAGGTAVTARGTAWVIFCDSRGVGARLATELTRRGVECWCVEPGQRYEMPGSGRIR